MNPHFSLEKHYILHFYHFIVFETCRLLICLPATAVTDYEQPRSSTMIRQLFMALTQSQIQQQAKETLCQYLLIVLNIDLFVWSVSFRYSDVPIDKFDILLMIKNADNSSSNNLSKMGTASLKRGVETISDWRFTASLCFILCPFCERVRGGGLIPL